MKSVNFLVQRSQRGFVHSRQKGKASGPRTTRVTPDQHTNSGTLQTLPPYMYRRLLIDHVVCLKPGSNVFVVLTSDGNASLQHNTYEEYPDM